MKRLLLVFFILPLLTTCEMFDNDMPAFLDFYTGTVKIERHLVDGSYLEDKSGRIHISPEEGRTITFHMNNQQKYDLKLGINWNDSLLAGAPQPDDYTLTQDTDNKSLIHLKFTKDFLDRKDKEVDGGDISATITLTEPQSGRAFESYDKLLLESNSPPPPFDSKDVFLMKNNDNDYVLCFKLPHVTEGDPAVDPTVDPTHQDIITLLITDNSGNKAPITYNINLTGGNRGDDAVTNNDDGKIIAYNNGDLSTWLSGESESEPVPDAEYYTNPDVIFYNTELAAGGSINYTVTLTDDKSLSSEAVISSEPPTIGGTIGVTINEVSGTVLHEGDYYTKNRTVTLRLSPVTDNVSGITGYHTTDGNKPLANAKWQNWNGNSPADSPAHTLAKPTTDGVKYIYVWIKDATGNVSVAAIVKVTLTTKVPTIKVTINEENGTVYDGDTYSTINSTVILKLSTEISGKGLTGYQITSHNDDTADIPPPLPTPPNISSGSWEPWNGNNPINNLVYTLKSDQFQTIYVWVRDATGNVSIAATVAQVKVIRGTATPSSFVVTINEEEGTVVYIGGKECHTTNNTITLRLAAETSGMGVTGYQITSDDTNPFVPSPPPLNSGNWDPWGGNSPIDSRPYILKQGRPQDIYAWVKDAIGKVTLAGTVKVTLFTEVVSVYLNPINGNDTNIGTESGKPVKTMAKAIALLGGTENALASNATILIMNTIPVNSNEDWSVATPLTIKNYPSFTGQMVAVTGGTLNLKNIIIDGEGRRRVTPLVKVTGSILNLNNGVILQNNNNDNDGGGVHVASNGTLNMSGTAQITKNFTNRMGGGVYVANGSTLNMSGTAQISHNNANKDGGGVYFIENTTNNNILNMSEDAHISYNEALDDGGGVWLENKMNSNTATNTSILNMSGAAHISNNKAIYGGGLRLNNTIMKSNIDSSILNMIENAHISDNEATKDGGGVWLYNTGYNIKTIINTNCRLTMGGSTKISGNRAVSGGGVHTQHYWPFNTSTGDAVHIARKNRMVFKMDVLAQISDNTATLNGGGVFCYIDHGSANNVSPDVTFDFDMSGATQINDNSAETGGGIYMINKKPVYGNLFDIASLTMTGTAQINRNTARRGGGGVYMSHLSPGGLFMRLSLSAGNLITDNEAGGFGGGVYRHGNPTIENNTGQIQGNTAVEDSDSDNIHPQPLL